MIAQLHKEIYLSRVIILSNYEEILLGDNLLRKHANQLQSLLIALSSNNKTLALKYINVIIKSIHPNTHVYSQSSNPSSIKWNIKNFIWSHMSFNNHKSKTYRHTIIRASMLNPALSAAQKKEITQVWLGWSKRLMPNVISDSTSSFQFPNYAQSPLELNKLQIDSILEFCYSDNCSRIDYNSNQCIKVRINNALE